MNFTYSDSTDRCDYQNSENYANIVSKLLPIILFCFLINACSTVHYYVPFTRELKIGVGRLTFELNNVDWPMEVSKGADTSYTMYEYLQRYKEIPYDPNLTYWKLTISHEGDIIIETPKTILKADSVVLNLLQPADSKTLKVLEQFTKIDPRGPKFVNIEPIPVPKSYKRDFELEFNLSILNESDSTVLDRIPIRLKINHKTRKYSPVFPGR